MERISVAFSQFMIRKITLTLLISSLIISNAYSIDGLVESLKRQLEIHKMADTSKVNLLNALSYQYQGINYFTALTYAKQAVHLADSLNFIKGGAIALNRLADCYWILGDSEIAVEKALKAASIAEQGNLINIQGESYRLLGVVYIDLRELDKAEKYLQKAERIGSQTKEWNLTARSYSNVAKIYSLKNQYDTSLSLYNKGLSIASKHNQSFYIPLIYANMGTTFLLAFPTKQKEVLQMYQKSLSLSKVEKNRYAEARALERLGTYYLYSDQKLITAEKYLQQSLNITSEMGLNVLKRDIYMHLMDLKIKQGDFWESHKYMKNYYALKDSLLNEKKIRQISSLETQYETEKKEQTIKLLEKEKEIQTIWRNVLIIGTLFFIIAGIFIFRLQRLRSQKDKQLLNAQEEINLKLKEADHLKSRFFANISHEFRTPLALILAPLEVKIATSSMNQSDKEDLKLVRRNAQRLLNLVNQLLDLSKLEAGKMELRLRPGDLSEFLTLLVASFDSLGESRKVIFTKFISVPNYLLNYDSDKLEKIITNILFNSFKFTHTGGTITVSFSITEDEHTLNILIIDTGKGISKEDIPHVFSSFYQSKNTEDDGQVGTGLGLALVNELVKLYGGRIELTSELNIGTRVFVSLPISRATETSLQGISNVNSLDTILHSKPESLPDEVLTINNEHEKPLILVIEDNLDLRNFIAVGFKGQYNVITARDGEEGFSLAMEHIPDLIVSDVMMPKMNGIELTDKVKSGECTSHIPVVLLTAKADINSRMQGYKSGADDYLSKPFSSEELQIRVNNLIQQRKRLAAKFKAELNKAELNQLIEPKEITQHEYKKEPSLDEKFLMRAKQVIESNLSESSFGVEKLAEEMNLSRAQLFRKFKAIINTSPSEFVNDIRLQRAADMIRSKADTLSQIGYAVGFNEQSYFAKRFRKKFGVSPSEYANKQSFNVV